MNLFTLAALSGLMQLTVALPECAIRATYNEVTPCTSACEELTLKFSQQVLHRNTSAYKAVTDNYWAEQQHEASPLCIFEPASADEVAALVLISRQTQCPFAIKAGGHGAFSGASSISNGITVSLKRLNEIRVLESNLVSIGAGNTWSAVYQALEQQDLAVAGGRYPTVGVGGLSLGGGVSFFASSKGWTCDNIQSFEVVTADGNIIRTSNTSFSDLHWALRGGGNNFGIITKIEMEAFPLPKGLMWGGSLIFNESQSENIIQAAYNVGTTGSASDQRVGQIVNFGLVQGNKIGMAILSHREPAEKPAVLDEFLSLPAIMHTTYVRTLSNLSAGFDGDSPAGESELGERRSRGTTTFTLNIELMRYAKDLCFKEFDSIADARGLVAICGFQLITEQQLVASEQKGGNAFGLDSSDGPLFGLNVILSWSDPADDMRVKQVAKAITDQATQFGESRGWHKQFRYMNYAGEFQDVLAGYGSDNKMKLEAIAKKYDPKGMFQKLLPGGFKLNGPPSSG